MKTRVMRLMACIAVCLSFMTGANSAGVSENDRWESLFDGKTLDGFIKRGGEARYRVENGAIVGTTVKGTPNTFLCTERLFGDFVLELDFNVDPRLNSGVQVRSESHQAYQDGRVHGYQVEIDPAERAWTGGIYDEARRKWLNDLEENEAARNAFKQNEWNHFRIEAIGSSIKTWLNGVPAADLTDFMTPVGFIALQVHGTKSDEPLEIRWRDIRIQDLDARGLPSQRPRTDDPYMGDWRVESSKDSPVKAAQVIALGWGKYQVNLLAEFDSRATPVWVMNGLIAPDGRTAGGKLVSFRSGDWRGEIIGDRFTVEKKGDEPWTSEMKPVERSSPTLGAKAPAGAIVLFDGTSFDKWEKAGGRPVGWKIVEGGAMEVVPKSGSIATKRGFTDIKLHLEFRTPFMPEARGQGRGNSGVYVQGRYEVQVLDSYGLEGRDNECGGIYKVAAPRVNMCAPPMQWQTYDITFRAARFDMKGKKTENARVTVVHNGVTIHEGQELPSATGSAKKKGEPPAPGPVSLQEHGNPMQYRNIWVVDLAS